MERIKKKRKHITILGHHISLIRPSKPKSQIVYKADLPCPKYDTKPKTNKYNSGRAKQVVIMLDTGDILGIDKGTHYQVVNKFDVDLGQVTKTGWLLENGKYLWR